MKFLTAAFAALYALCAAAFAGDQTAQIEAQNQKFASAFAAGDAAAVAALYSEDGAILPPGADMLSGHEAIAAFWQGAMDGGVKSVTLTTVEVYTINKDNVVEVGGAELFDAEGAAIGTGHYVVYWRKVDGEWLLFRDIWN